ncbi:MAG: hypothetical protein ISR90_06670 [Candidatus Marinimicrobia bacterium]|nr:hypothetical protein [Candidatus Neomarinimicrobiota bacterium]MBL7023715.1 hypothetical protein [Candidatus Neomarinimicrobiota bacterium]MBL7109496.1 hypothetical protein [Candidatus Neomarinimicrobiota bacterium]
MQRAIWIITFLMILSGVYYWFVIHEEDIIALDNIAVRNELQSDSINTVAELENRLELRYIGHGKHLQTIQNEFREHYANYTAKVDSIDMVLEGIKFSIEQLDEKLVKKINRVQDDLRNLSDDFDRNKRSTNRTLRDLQQDLSTLEDDVKKIEQYMPAIIAKLKLDKE